jgi:hypothetical protein
LGAASISPEIFRIKYQAASDQIMERMKEVWEEFGNRRDENGVMGALGISGVPGAVWD